ncbi:MAG TPA: Clp protease N-terminal domain-containing protein [Trebonia sp.]|jgi:ATP-dependent Clp protease ATP-binding subunit ClpA|nr:Clp protease N-terminal domain-containing protein [Trebonia sp.]
MADVTFPVPLDNLITYVKTLHPDGGPLDNVSDAFTVSAQLDEQADALIGHFVDQARKSGASWSQIGAAMGVSKQAAQKRFVPVRAPDSVTFERFTDRSRNVIAAAGQLAAGPVTAAHLAAALLVEPLGIAAKIIAAAGLTPEQVYDAAGAGPATPAQDATAAALREITYAETGAAALKGALKAALRRGHNYIGTEHLLLGLLATDDPVAAALDGLGLTLPRAEAQLATELAGFQARREQA